MTFRTDKPDPAWNVKIQSRSATLWIGPSWKQFIGSEDECRALREVILRPWAAVFVDAPDAPLADLRRIGERVGDLVLRIFDEDPDQRDIPPNRLPVFCLWGPEGKAAAGQASDPRGALNRLKMLERIPAGCDMFTIGIVDPIDFAGLVEARRVSPAAISRIILVSAQSVSLDQLDDGDGRASQWLADYVAFRNLLEASSLEAETRAARILVLGDGKRRGIDLGSCIDPSYPITETFALIPEFEILKETSVGLEGVESFLADPTSSWQAYSAGVPFLRRPDYEHSLRRKLRHIARDGPTASCTAWLPCEDGSGATTALRQLCWCVARDGYPTLLAKRDSDRFDFRQLATFLTAAAARFEAAGLRSHEVPWVVAFDAQHFQSHAAFISGVCNGLRGIHRSVVILVARPEPLQAIGKSTAPHGPTLTLGSPLRNTVSLDEATELGAHLATFLPDFAKRTPSEWRFFIEDTIRTSVGGRQSLFWVALRFWLFKVPGAEQSLRKWLAAKFRQLTEGKPAASEAILEVAALSKHRLVCPLQLLREPSADIARTLVADLQNPIGLRFVPGAGGGGVSLAHPVIAEEILRISLEDPAALESVGKDSCLNLLDLELHLLGRLIVRPRVATAACIRIVEELVTSALRVDPRDAPRNYEVRDRIVHLLEQAPDALWDASQVFNHHVAKARRHLAVEPPTTEWTLEARIEQLQLAERHLIDAMEHIHPEESDRRESPLHLYVSLALTYDAHARLEEQRGDSDSSVTLEARAQDAFRSAQRLDAENSYVLENYARFLLRKARATDDDEEQTKLLVDAIALLELELLSDETGTRQEPVLLELGSAYDILQDRGGKAYLETLAADGSEAALLALAKLGQRNAEDRGDKEKALADAELLLRKVPAEAATWRSRYALYVVVSRLRPHAFGDRLDLLSELDALGDFAWPQQVTFEFGVLLFQVGDKRKGKVVFQRIRDELRDKSGSIRVPKELRFLADPAADYQEPLRTSLIVKATSRVGRDLWGCPNGWHDIEVPFRAYQFARDEIRPRQELDCLIQFTSFGPQAVPPSTQ